MQRILEWKKIFDNFEKLSAVERRHLLEEKSMDVLEKLRYLRIPDIDPEDILAGFIIGSVVADGRIKESEYLLIYPALVKTFGADYDFITVKKSFLKNRDGIKIIETYTDQMLTILRYSEEDLKQDVITLCLCVMSVDRKISLKEKRYLRTLFEAI